MEEIKQICFSDVSDFAVWHRLRKLSAARLIEKRSLSTSKKSFWILSHKGFEILRGTIDELRENGYGTENPEHDYIVSSFQVGYFLKNPSTYVEYFTEQELRREMFENYPHWVPQTEVHRCDGYLRLKQGNIFEVVAIEVELSQKAKIRYEALAEFYEEQKKVDQVLWIVRDKQMGKKIFEIIESKRRQRPLHHSFVDFEDFKINDWDTKIYLGYRKGVQVAHLFTGNPSVSIQ